MLTRRTISIGRQRFRVGPWHADHSIALLGVDPRSTAPSAEELRHCLEEVRSLGYGAALTSALDASEAPPFLEVGFAEHDRLQVLRHDLDGLQEMGPVPDGVTLRRGRQADRAPSLAVDAEAFADFWQLDEVGLSEAESATPSSRFRVAISDGRLVGYAVTGRGGQQGFLQRLAVDPAEWRRGIGAALVGDSLRWCARRRCQRVFVNTQVHNAGALALYDRLGFHPTPNDLVVLLWSP